MDFLRLVVNNNEYCTAGMTGSLSPQQISRSRCPTMNKWNNVWHHVLCLGSFAFFLGGICLTGYFLTPGYEKDGLNNRSLYQFSDKPHALPFGIAVMSIGLLAIAIAACDDRWYRLEQIFPLLAFWRTSLWKRLCPRHMTEFFCFSLIGKETNPHLICIGKVVLAFSSHYRGDIALKIFLNIFSAGTFKFILSHGKEQIKPSHAMR